MAFDLSFLNNYKNKKLIVKNTSSKITNISDLKIILNPSGTTGDSIDLLKQDSITKRTLRNIKDIHDSRDLQLLVVTKVIDLYNENGKIENIQEALDHSDLSTIGDIPETGGGGGIVEWGNINGSITDQGDLNSALNNKADSIHTHAISDVTNLQNSLDNKANSVHTHVIGDVTNLQDSLNNKADSVHTHNISDVTNLQTTLNGKANTSHTHTLSQITDAGSAASKAAPSTGVNASTTEVVMGDDTRLTNSRTPTAHVHNTSEITGGVLSIARGGTGMGTVGAPNTILGVNGAGTLLEYKSLEDVGGAEWGNISGTLSSQTDLNNALNSKANTSHNHSTSDITSGVLDISRGGTGIASLGDPGQVLTTNNDSSGMVWTTPSGGGGGGGATYLARVVDLQSDEYNNAYSFDIGNYLTNNGLDLAMHNIFVLKNLAYETGSGYPVYVHIPDNLSSIPEGTTLEIRAWNEAPGDQDNSPSGNPDDIPLPSRSESYWKISRGGPGTDNYAGVEYFPSLSRWDGYCKLVVGKQQRRLFDEGVEIGTEYFPTWILVDYMVKRPDGTIGAEFY